MAWYLTDEQVKLLGGIREEQEKYGKRVAKKILALPTDFQCIGLLIAYDVKLPVVECVAREDLKRGKEILIYRSMGTNKVITTLPEEVKNEL